MFKEKLLKEALKLYAGEHVLKEVLKKGYDFLRLGGQKEEATVYFQEIAGFTSQAKPIDLTELVHLQRDYLNSMTECVYKHGGILDKYVGDSFSAFWIDKDQQIKAILCALNCLQISSELSVKWADKGVSEINILIGIDSGPVYVGNFGSEKKLEYTVMGNVVNLSSRLVQANKIYKTQIMISEDTFKLAKDTIIARPLDRIHVKGRGKSVLVFELVGRRDGQIPDNILNMLPVFTTGYRHYLNRDWKKAEDCFASCLEKVPDDGPSQHYLERCREFSEKPPINDQKGIEI